MINSLDSFLHSGASLFSSPPPHAPSPCAAAAQQVEHGLAASQQVAAASQAGGASQQGRASHDSGGAFPTLASVRQSHSHPGLLDLGAFVGSDLQVERSQGGCVGRPACGARGQRWFVAGCMHAWLPVARQASATNRVA
jgi:hypothetical protein